MDAWDIFCMTGHIDDYLHYRQSMNAMPQNAPAAKEKQTQGDLSGTGSGGTQCRRTGEVH